jgi:hypothetical protein
MIARISKPTHSNKLSSKLNTPQPPETNQENKIRDHSKKFPKKRRKQILNNYNNILKHELTHVASFCEEKKKQEYHLIKTLYQTSRTQKNKNKKITKQRKRI